MEIGTLKYSNLLEIASGPMPYLLEDFIPEKSIGILVGEWGIGKSPFAMQLQLSLAAGVPFLGKFKVRDTKVSTLYVDLENGAQPIVSLFSTLAKYMDIPVSEGINVYSPNYGTKIKELEQAAEDMYVRQLIERNSFDFIIIDPLRMFRPEAEAKNTDAATMIRHLRKLTAKCNCTIMLIHHPRKISGDADVQRFKLDTNPTEWMSNACGAASLIQNADFRIGLEQNEDGYIVMRRFIRNKGWYPSEYVGRAFDPESEEPIGYMLEDGVEKLQAIERSWLRDLQHTFKTSEAKIVIMKHDQIVNQWLKRLKHLRIIKKVGHGTWEKLVII